VRYLRFIVALATLCVVAAGSLPASAEDYGTKDQAVAMVKHAIARVNEIGFDAAKVEFMDHNGKFIDRDLYLIVVDLAGVRVVHGQNPKLIGKTYIDAVDVNGKEYGKEVMQIAAGPGTGWVSFMFKDPITGKVLPKQNYVEKAGDYIYLAGVYTR
jgi:signal transduction histidine kinase